MTDLAIVERLDTIIALLSQGQKPEEEEDEGITYAPRKRKKDE